MLNPHQEEITQLAELIPMNNPMAVLGEAEATYHLMCPSGDFTIVRKVFEDIWSLFKGDFDGYRKCNTPYHDFQHTSDVLIAMTRLLHGATVEGIRLSSREASLGMIAALMHDTGYIQTTEENEGTGAVFTRVHIERGILFLKRYFKARGFSQSDFEFCRNCIYCTCMEIDMQGIAFSSTTEELIAKMLGAADLLGQMADRIYLEKLDDLFHEFKEGGITDFKNELDLVSKTAGFYNFARKRLSGNLANAERFMRAHFQQRWGLDKDLYTETIKRNLDYLQKTLANYGANYKQNLRRHT